MTAAAVLAAHDNRRCVGLGRCTCPCDLCGAFGDRYDASATGDVVAGTVGDGTMTGPRHGSFGRNEVGEREQPEQPTPDSGEGGTDTSDQPTTTTTTTTETSSDGSDTADEDGGQG